MSKFLCVIGLALFCVYGFATDLKSCSDTDVQYQAQDLILHLQKDHQPKICLLHNVSNTIELWLNYEKQDPGASAGWGSSLKGGRWSAMMVSQPRFKLSCAKMLNNELINVNCRDFLTACCISNFNSKADVVLGTTYWIAEDASFAAIVEKMQARGIFATPLAPAQ